MSTIEDEGKLIRAAACGDRRSFDRLVRAKREQVIRVAYQVTGDWEDAVDVSQAVFIKLWQGLGKFDARRRFDTWLHRITVNAAIDMIRSPGRRMLQPLPEDGPDPVDTRTADADATIDLAQLQGAFRTLAARLAPKQRCAFVLREIEGLDTAEVARIMGVTESTVRNHLHQARRSLKAGLEREFPGLVPGGSGEPG